MAIDIDLSYDYFKTLEAGLPKLKNLRHLFLFGCNLAELPESIKELKGLELLNLSGNRLQTFPHIITTLKSLQALCIDHYTLKEVPEAIGQLENLKFLAINPIDKIIVKDGEIFFPERIGIDFEIDYEELYKFTHLEKLDLAGVKKEIIEKIDFTRFPIEGS